MQNIGELRAQMRQWEKILVDALGPLDDDLEFYHAIPLPDGQKSNLKVVRPKSISQSADHPLVILFHGGGFAVGSVEMMTRPARDFASKFGAVVVSASYRLAPEHKFPTQVQDGWDTLLWLVANASPQFGAQLERGFVVGGFSAGGTLAAVLAQLAHDRNLDPPLTGTFISIPFLLVDEIIPEQYKSQWTSREENTKDPAVNSESIAGMIRNLEPDIRSPLFSPFNSPNPHRGLPPTYIQVAGLDPLRDDGLVYEKALRENDVRTGLDNYPELTHGGWTVFANETSPKELGTNTLRAMGWLLGGLGHGSLLCRSISNSSKAISDSL